MARLYHTAVPVEQWLRTFGADGCSLPAQLADYRVVHLRSPQEVEYCLVTAEAGRWNQTIAVRPLDVVERDL